MIALRQTAIEKRIPWVCADCHPDATEGLCSADVQVGLGCAPGAVASEALRFTFGGRIAKKNLFTELEFDRCPLAILRDAASDTEAWTEWAIRMSMASDNGCVDVTAFTPGELALIHLADDARAAVKVEHLAEAGDGGEG
jgi:hypothetical protein|tara:strand:- start:1287 stop:1706 length:420 start_codon:yes stop_codon:yes gene_type:complete